jgi:carboxyl-terminal processing protease
MPTAGKDIDEIVSHIRGKAGTPVMITVVRQGAKKPLNIRAVRAKIIIPTVESAMLPGTKFGRIAVSQFAEPTAEQFDRGVQKLAADGMKGLVVDLRGNPGGLLETAVEMLSRFVSDKVVVRMKGRDGREEVARTYVGQAKKWPFPIVILINEDSASASEIFAGCMHDYHLATLVGEHSYGKASVQNVRMLVDGASAKITIARYFLPSTGDISRKVDEDGQYISGGLKPDVLAEFDVDSPGVLGDLKTDSQLKKAIEVLKSKV